MQRWVPVLSFTVLVVGYFSPTRSNQDRQIEITAQVDEFSQLIDNAVLVAPSHDAYILPCGCSDIQPFGLAQESRVLEEIKRKLNPKPVFVCGINHGFSSEDWGVFKTFYAKSFSFISLKEQAYSFLSKAERSDATHYESEKAVYDFSLSKDKAVIAKISQGKQETTLTFSHSVSNKKILLVDPDSVETANFRWGIRKVEQEARVARPKLGWLLMIGSRGDTLIYSYLPISGIYPSDQEISEGIERLPRYQKARMTRIIGDTEPSVGFLRADRCESCHEQEFKQWEKTRHAGALNTLLKNKRTELECLPCHSEKARLDPSSMEVDHKPEGVTCVTCHTISKTHLLTGDVRYTQKTVDEKTCKTCHTTTADVNGNYLSHRSQILHKPSH